MSEFYFFKDDANCRWLMKEVNEVFPKYLHDPIDYNGKKVKFYVILDWVLTSDRGANLSWVKEIGVNVVDTINDLPEDGGIYITGYDSNYDQIKKAEEKGIPIIDHACPWVSQFKKQVLTLNPLTHQGIIMIDKGHVVYKCLNSKFPKDTIVINTDNYKEEIKLNKNNKPVKFIVYTVFRIKDCERVIKFINENYPHDDNILYGYKKTLCMWTKQGLCEEIENKVNEHNLNEVWIICSSQFDRSTMSIINEVKENGAIPVIIKKEEDIPEKINNNIKIGVLKAPLPLPKKAIHIKEKIKNLYLDNGENTYIENDFLVNNKN